MAPAREAFVSTTKLKIIPDTTTSLPDHVERFVIELAKQRRAIEDQESGAQAGGLVSPRPRNAPEKVSSKLWKFAEKKRELLWVGFEDRFGWQVHTEAVFFEAGKVRKRMERELIRSAAKYSSGQIWAVLVSDESKALQMVLHSPGYEETGAFTGIVNLSFD